MVHFCVRAFIQGIKRTRREMTPMITIPRVAFNLSDTAARVCPPTMQLRMRNPCIEKTFRMLGMTDP
jgi:hypothetical protein